MYMNISKKELARTLRKRQTRAEIILWDELRGNKLGLKFRRQYPIDKFFLDFYCFDKKLGIEVDGGIHKIQLAADKEREEIVKTLGIKIIRFTNDEVIENLQNVLNKIKTELRM